VHVRDADGDILMDANGRRVRVPEEEARVMTVEDWIQSALDGKLAECRKRANPEAVLSAEVARLKAELAAKMDGE